jgi:hypothetical protein
MLHYFSDVPGKPYRTSLRLNSTAQIYKGALILTIVVTHFRRNCVGIFSRILAARAAAERTVCDAAGKMRMGEHERYEGALADSAWPQAATFDQNASGFSAILAGVASIALSGQKGL